MIALLEREVDDWFFAQLSSNEQHIAGLAMQGPQNRTVAAHRLLLSLALACFAFTAAAAQNNGTLGTSCMTAGCYQAVFDALNDVIDRTSGHFLRTTVDGTAWRSLLQLVPTPAP